MFNISFFQILVLLALVFLLFGDFKLLKSNLTDFKQFLSKFNKKKE